MLETCSRKTDMLVPLLHSFVHFRLQLFVFTPRSTQLSNWLIDPFGLVTVLSQIYLQIVSLPFSLLSVVFWPILQQLVIDIRVQKQRRMCDKQKEPHSMQSVPVAEMSHGGHVQEWQSLRTAIELVQDPLPAAGATASGGGSCSQR